LDQLPEIVDVAVEMSAFVPTGAKDFSNIPLAARQDLFLLRASIHFLN